MWEIQLAPAGKVLLPPYLLLAFVSPYDVELSWSAPHFPNNVSGYNVYRNNELIATTSSTSYLDRYADRKIYNSYKVSAVYSAGEESGFTNIIEVLAPVSLPYEQQFESGTQGWKGKFSVDGWNYGTENELSITGNDGLFFGINSAYAGTDIHVKDYLLTPTIDLAEHIGQTITLEFDYTLRRYLRYDHLFVVYRQDMESDWITLEELEPAQGTGWIWEQARIDLPQEALVDGMQIGFLYDDSNEHAWGAGIDNVKLYINTTSILDLALQSTVTVFPNPNQGEFEVLIELEEITDVSLIVRDVLGRSVWKNQFIPESLKTKQMVNISEFPKGNYQLTVNYGKEEFNQLVIIH